jgi:hypothetical protein
MTKVIDLIERVKIIGYIENAIPGYPPTHHKWGDLFVCKDCFDKNPVELGDGPFECRPITAYDAKNLAKVNPFIWWGPWDNGACRGCLKSIFREEEEDGIYKPSTF